MPKFLKYSSILCLISLISCSNSREKIDLTLPESTFVAYLADSLILNEFCKIEGIERSRWIKMVDSLRRHHGCDQAGLEKSHLHYSSEIHLFDSLVSMVERKIEFIQQESLKNNKIRPVLD